jgi:hypothetical protein
MGNKYRKHYLNLLRVRVHPGANVFTVLQDSSPEIIEAPTAWIDAEILFAIEQGWLKLEPIQMNKGPVCDCCGKHHGEMRWFFEVIPEVADGNT